MITVQISVFMALLNDKYIGNIQLSVEKQYKIGDRVAVMCNSSESKQNKFIDGQDNMKYYIVKAKSAKVQQDLVQGLQHLDKDAKIVKNIEESDICILQRGWARSKIAIEERYLASSVLGKPCREGYLFTDRYKVHLN